MLQYSRQTHITGECQQSNGRLLLQMSLEGCRGTAGRGVCSPPVPLSVVCCCCVLLLLCVFVCVCVIVVCACVCCCVVYLHV
jgi:hypothetical protein